MIVYKVTNRLNGKFYIGATSLTIEERKKMHMRLPTYSDRTYFQKALQKYGIENFKWQIVCICHNKETLNAQEQKYIKMYDAMEKGYNDTSGGIKFSFSGRVKKQMRASRQKYLKEKGCYGKDFEDYYHKKHYGWGDFILEDENRQIMIPNH